MRPSARPSPPTTAAEARLLLVEDDPTARIRSAYLMSSAAEPVPRQGS